MPPRPWPRLSETLSCERRPDECQCCGANYQARKLWLWLEHDENDRPTGTLVALCEACSRRLIEDHPRLYEKLPENKPVPGAMPHLCAGCEFRRGLMCSHPDLKSNGGEGLLIAVEPPLRGFWDGQGKNGRRTGGVLEIWSRPATRCQGQKSGPDGQKGAQP